MKIRDYLILTGILLLTFVIFFNSLKSDFTNYDDDIHVLKNEDITSLALPNVKKIFTSYYVGMYQPLTTLSFALDYSLHKLNPFWYHLHNLVLHLLNCIFVFLLLFRLTGKKSAAYFCMLLFAVHPMHVESVAWITERKDVLFSSFYLLGLISYLKYLETRRTATLILVFILFVLSCLSKSAAVTFPLIMVLIDLYRNVFKEKKLQLLKLPFFIAAVCFGIISIASQGALLQKAGLAADYSIFQRLVLAFYALSFYISSFIFPFRLSVMHPYPLLTDGSLPFYFHAVSLFLIAACIGTWYLIRKSNDREFIKLCLYDFLFFLLPILLVLQVPVGSALVAERYTYLPYIGLSLLLYRVGSRLAVNLNLKRYMITIPVVLFIFALSLLAFQRVKVWKNSYELTNDVIKKYPSNASIAYNNRALSWVEKGNYNAALADVNKSILQSTDYAEAIQNRAFIRHKMNDQQGALQDYNVAIKLNPKKANWYVNRAITKELLQDYYGAIDDYTTALKIDPEYVKAYIYRADDWFVLGNYLKAIHDLNEVIRIQPDIIESYTKRCFNYIKLGRINEACLDCSYAAGLGDQVANSLLNEHCK